MRKYCVFFIILTLNLAQAKTGSYIDSILEKQISELVTIFKTLHSMPELAHFEKSTARLIADQLKSMDYEVTEQFGQYQNPQWTSYGIVAVLKNGPGPVVLFRADMDALPIEEKTDLPYASKVTMKNDLGGTTPVMHACGHDLHSTVLLGIAALLHSMRQKWSGTLMLIAQPAEEVADDGANAILRAGLYEKFAKPDFILAFHADDHCEAGKLRTIAGPCMADVANIDIRVHGIGGHGASPHTCKDPVVLAAQIILALQTIVSREIDPSEAAVLTIGSIHGGSARNIIPEEVTLQLTLRSFKPQIREQMIRAIERICLNLAAAAGMPKEKMPVVTTISITPAVYNNPDLTSRIGSSFKKAIGNDKVSPASPVMIGEDFTFYSQDGQIPASLVWLGIVDPATLKAHEQEGTPLLQAHSSWYCVTPEPAIRTGVKAMSTAIMDLMKEK